MCVWRAEHLSEAAPETESRTTEVSTRKDHRFLADLYNYIEREFDLSGQTREASSCPIAELRGTNVNSRKMELSS